MSYHRSPRQPQQSRPALAFFTVPRARHGDSITNDKGTVKNEMPLQKLF
nr:MAG TPA: hypothetical protein [Caudoviricetes sp.]DAT06920.1 MAG TPA: hypothetical protein [Caudoviricetes sp.]